MSTDYLVTQLVVGILLGEFLGYLLVLVKEDWDFVAFPESLSGFYYPDFGSAQALPAPGP